MAISPHFGTSFGNSSVKQINKQLNKEKIMETIETKAAKLGLEKGYFLLLMAILEEPTDQNADDLATAS